MREATCRAPGRSRGRALAAAAPLAASSSASAEPVTATWKSASSGNWIDGTRWSTDPAFPDNGVPAGVTYQAVINASGVGYAVTVGQDIAVDGVLLDAANATSV